MVNELKIGTLLKLKCESHVNDETKLLLGNLLPHIIPLPILLRRYPHQLRKHPRKIIRIIDPQLLRCFFNGNIR